MTEVAKIPIANDVEFNPLPLVSPKISEIENTLETNENNDLMQPATRAQMNEMEVREEIVIKMQISKKIFMLFASFFLSWHIFALFYSIFNIADPHIEEDSIIIKKAKEYSVRIIFYFFVSIGSISLIVQQKVDLLSFKLYKKLTIGFLCFVLLGRAVEILCLTLILRSFPIYDIFSLVFSFVMLVAIFFMFVKRIKLAHEFQKTVTVI